VRHEFVEAAHLKVAIDAMLRQPFASAGRRFEDMLFAIVFETAARSM
jgi:hypothetical protein